MNTKCDKSCKADRHTLVDFELEFGCGLSSRLRTDRVEPRNSLSYDDNTLLRQINK